MFTESLNPDFQLILPILDLPHLRGPGGANGCIAICFSVFFFLHWLLWQHKPWKDVNIVSYETDCPHIRRKCIHTSLIARLYLWNNHRQNTSGESIAAGNWTNTVAPCLLENTKHISLKTLCSSAVQLCPLGSIVIVLFCSTEKQIYGCLEIEPACIQWATEWIPERRHRSVKRGLSLCSPALVSEWW